MEGSARLAPAALRRALTMIELLVVISIIAVLISIVAVASSSLIGRSRENSTKAMLAVVSQAVEEFKREKPPITQRRDYLARYGPYPPDELEVFVTGVPVNPPSTTPKSLAPGNAKMVPAPPYTDMRFFADGSALDVLEHRDLAAMVVAIETLTESAASILGHLPERNRIAAILDPTTRAPGQFLDRQTGTVGSFDADDHEVRLIVDDWGNPLGYMAQRDWKASPATPIKSTNHQADWNQTSTDFVRLNGGAPVIFSWGADGEAQLTKDTMTTTATASLVADWVNDPNDSDKPAINNLMNADNVYANPALKEKLTEGITQ